MEGLREECPAGSSEALQVGGEPATLEGQAFQWGGVKKPQNLFGSMKKVCGVETRFGRSHHFGMKKQAGSMSSVPHPGVSIPFASLSAEAFHHRRTKT